MARNQKYHLVGLSVLVSFLFACNKFQDPIETTENDVDSLEIAITNLKNINKEEIYEYTCTKDTSQFEYAGPLTSGIANVQVTDEQGNVLLNESFASVETFEKKLISSPGVWTVKLNLINTSGTVTCDLKAL